MLDQENFYLLSLHILIIYFLDDVSILWGEVTCLSLLGVKGFTEKQMIHSESGVG